MATSDNVVRAGLTPKYKDVETLVDLLTFESGPVSILEGSPEQDIVYHAPVSEFQVSRWRVSKTRKVAGNALRVLLVTQEEVLIRWSKGEMALRRGQSVLIPALLDEFELTSSSSAECFQVEVPAVR
jgi:mannose-6-phosphate isomerase